MTTETMRNQRDATATDSPLTGDDAVFAGQVVCSQDVKTHPKPSIIEVPFYGTFIYTVLLDGVPHVLLRPTLEAMGLDWGSQFRKLNSRSWATVVETTTVGADGRKRRMAAVSLDVWAMFLANINENTVKKELRPIIIAYQKESGPALRQFFTEGAAINPRASETQLQAKRAEIDELLVARRKEQVDYKRIIAALSASGAVDKDYRQVQDTLYLGLFGASAKTIRDSRPQLQGERYRVGPNKGELRPSTVAKNYLTEQELQRLNEAVQWMTSMAALRYPDGVMPLDSIKLMAMTVGQLAAKGREAINN